MENRYGGYLAGKGPGDAPKKTLQNKTYLQPLKKQHINLQHTQLPKEFPLQGLHKTSDHKQDPSMIILPKNQPPPDPTTPC